MKKASRRYAVCLKNAGNEASLERNKIYVVLPDRTAAADGLVRVIDEPGPLRCVGTMGAAEFLQDGKTVEAVVRNLEIVGEAAKQGPEDVLHLT
jgi:hypothetical protein